MNIPGADPAAAIKEISDKMKADAEESGMGAVDAFIDKLEDLKEKAQEGPGEMMEKIKGAVEGVKKTMSDAMENPSSLAPSSLAPVASWYGNEVVKKLKAISEEVEEIFKSMKELAESLATPFKEAAKTMKEAMAGLTQTVKGLSSLPGQLQGLADSVKGADDVKGINTDAMKKATDVSGITGPLDALVQLKSLFAPLIDLVTRAIGKLTDFVTSSPDKVRESFGVPAPCCCLTPVILSQAPDVMKTLLDGLENLSKLDFQPMTDMISSMADTLGNLDIDKVKGPLEKFAGSAQDSVGKLDNVVKAANMSSNPMGAVGGMFG